MKSIKVLGACALVAAGFLTSAVGQVQVAGNLQVNVDATSLPVGPVTSLANGGAAGGVFLPTTSTMTAAQVLALGGNGTHGALVDGNNIYFRHFTAATGGTNQAPPATFAGANPVFSVEAWVCKGTVPNDNTVISWGNRTTKNAVACNYGRNTGYGGFSWFGADYGWAVLPSPGMWHHLAWTYDGAGTLVMYRDGVIDRTVTGITGLNIYGAGTNYIALGVEHAGTGTAIASVELIGRVRIHDGVLTAAQVANNYNYEAPSFTNGVPAQFVSGGPLHRYSFNLPATNNALGLTITDTGSAYGTASQADAVVKGSNIVANLPAFDGAQLVFPNVSGGNFSSNCPYVELPGGLVSSTSSSNAGPGQITFEVWATETAAKTWARIFDFGSNTLGRVLAPGGVFNGYNTILLAAQNSGDTDRPALGISTGGGNFTFGGYLLNVQIHFVVTWDELTGVIKIYENGVQMAGLTTTAKMNSLKDINNWLGRSNWAGDQNFCGNYREFRIYSRVLSDAEVLHNFQAGPAVLDDPTTLAWNGLLGGVWDSSTYNWLAGGVSTNYADGDALQFDDTAAGTTTVSISGTVMPKGNVLVANSAKDYTLTGTGKISGAAGLIKSGSGKLSVDGTLANDFTGPVALQGGTLVVSSLANGGAPSGIGASAAAPSNLLFNGGGLSYRGTSTAINRGYTVNVPESTLDLQADLSLSGNVQSAPGGTFIKTGSGTMTYTGSGSNMLSGGVFPGYRVAGGSVVFDGTGGTGLTNRNMSEFWVGTSTASGAGLLVTNSYLLLDSWLTVGRGNGTVGNLSTVTVNNGGLIFAANGLDLGYEPALTNYSAKQTATLNGSSMMYCAGDMTVGDSPGASATLYLNDNSWLRCVTPRLGRNLGATGTVYIASSAQYTNTGYTSIGTGTGTNGVGSGGVGRMVVKDNAVMASGSAATGVDFNVTDLANSVGELDIYNSATLYIAGAMYVGKGAGTVATVNQNGGTVLKYSGGDFLIAGNASAASTSVGTWNLVNGVLSVNGNFQPGAYGQGTFNQSGGTVYLGAWTSIGRYAGGVGVVNISGGAFNSTNTTTDLIVGEAGMGTLNVSGAGLVSVAGTLRLGNASTASGTVNLDGGTLNTRRVWMANGTSTFLFNGGLLQAGSAPYSDFMSGLSIAYVAGGGARIDSAGNDITIAQDLYDYGQNGGLTKLGLGSLTLSGYLNYAGPTVVSAGKLVTSTRATSTAAVTVADGAELSVQVMDALNNSTKPSSLTAGATTGAALTIGLGNSFGNPTVAPIDVSAGTVTANGTVTVNVDPSSTVSVGEIPLIAYGSLAGSGTFVLGSLPPGVFGYLTNDTAGLTKFIGVMVTSVKLPRWEGLAGGFWDAQVTTNWIDQSTGLPDYFYQGARAVFNDQALGTTLVNLVTNVTPGGVLVSNSSLVYTISGIGRISGNAGLTKLGTNTLTLSTTNNNYTGPTLIDEGGTLITTLPNNLGTNNALVITNASLLSLGTNSQKFNSVTLANGTIAATGATITARNHSLDNGSVGAILAGGTVTTFGTNTDIVSVTGGNTYTGRTLLAGSTLLITNVGNGGAASSLGASSSNPTNLVFSGGGLSFNGPVGVTDRGYSVAAGGALAVQSGDLTFAGPITASGGNFVKQGPGRLIHTALGTNVLSVGGGANAYNIGAGTVLLSGNVTTNTLQTNRITGELWVGYDQVNAGALTLTNTSLAVSSWLAIDRGNGTVGSSSKVTLYNSLLTVGNLSSGYANGIAGNSSYPVLTLLSNSSITSANQVLIGESVGANGQLLIGDSSRLTLTAGWLSVGVAGTATMTLSNTARVTAPGDYNLGDVTSGNGTLNMYDNTTNLGLTMYIGKGASSFGVVNQYGGYVGKSATGGGDWRLANNASASGTYNLYGGIVEPQNNFQFGSSGNGFWNQTGGIANFGSWPSIGRFAGGVGVVTVSGGTFTQTASGNNLIVGEEGTGTLTVTNTGTVVSLGGVSLGHTGTGAGTVNLDGGTLVAPRIFQNGNGGSSTMNFNGGLLLAGAGNTAFVAGLSNANVLARGAFISSSNYSITIPQALTADAVSTGGGLTKLGVGTLTLSGANSYTGVTMVNEGTLAVNGSIAGAASVASGATLAGTGVVNGTVTIQAGGTLSAGPGAPGIGALTLNASPVLGGTVLAEIDRNGGAPLADLITVAGSPVAYGGTLVITNTGTNLVAGDAFKLFQASGYSGAFTLVSATPNQVVTWDTSRLTVDGTIIVASVAPLLPSTPTNIVGVVVGANLEISWPTNYTGWVLQGQTNTINVGISNNWATVPGSSTTNRMIIPINLANPTAYYRLAHP